MKPLFCAGLFFTSLVILGCSSSPLKPSTTTSLPSAPMPKETDPIDVLALQRRMGLERERENLGFEFKPFQTCDVGYGFSPTKLCRQAYLFVIHFRLQCRASNGTVQEVTQAELVSIADAEVKWSLGAGQKAIQGRTTTNSDGFGQIVGWSEKSPQKQRLRLSVGPDFLFLPAEEIRRVVVPQEWCP